MLVLPIDNTFLYVEPIYIQSSQARMPQLKKVVLAMGNTLIYRDTYEEALAELTGGATQPTPTTITETPAAPGTNTAITTTPAPPITPSPPAGASVDQFASTSGVTASYRLKAAGPKPARNWRRSRNWWAGSPTHNEVRPLSALPSTDRSGLLRSRTQRAAMSGTAPDHLC